MIEKFSMETQILENQVIVELAGCIDEDADFEKILSIKQPQYIFNFDKVTMINSCGIREWINFVEKLPSDCKIEYHNCRQIIIEQINMVQGFIRKGASIVNFYAPYFCNECDVEKKIKLETKQLSTGHAPSIKCDSCSKELEFDAIEEQYFAFLSQK